MSCKNAGGSYQCTGKGCRYNNGAGCGGSVCASTACRDQCKLSGAIGAYKCPGPCLSLPQRLTYNSVADSNPSVSGDGQWIAFISGTGSSAELWVISRDGATCKQLTWDSVPESSPSISSDGQYIAFVSGSGSSAELWVMRIDYSYLRWLTYDSVPESSSAISGDGQWVVFIRGSDTSAELWLTGR